MKHLHMTIALISVALFTLRFFWTLAGSAQLEKKWIKITPHIVDTLLLVLGVVMMMKLALNPLISSQFMFSDFVYLSRTGNRLCLRASGILSLNSTTKDVSRRPPWSKNRKTCCSLP